MVVFYCDEMGGRRCHSFIRYMVDEILEEDISWWAIPGTLED